MYAVVFTRAAHKDPNKNPRVKEGLPPSMTHLIHVHYKFMTHSQDIVKTEKEFAEKKYLFGSNITVCIVNTAQLLHTVQ